MPLTEHELTIFKALAVEGNAHANGRTIEFNFKRPLTAREEDIVRRGLADIAGADLGDVYVGPND